MTYSRDTRRQYRKLFEKAAKELAKIAGITLKEKKPK